MKAVLPCGGLSNGAARNDRSASGGRLVALGYVLAISIPPLGLVLGLALSFSFRRRFVTHSVGIVALSIAASIVWIVLLSSGAFRTPTTGY